MDSRQHYQWQNQHSYQQNYASNYNPKTQSAVSNQPLSAQQSKYPSRSNNQASANKNRFFSKSGYGSNPVSSHQRQTTQYQQSKLIERKHGSRQNLHADQESNGPQYDRGSRQRESSQVYSNLQDQQENNGTFLDQSEIQDDDRPQKILVSPRQRKITQIIVNNNSQSSQVVANSPQKMFSGNNFDRFSRPPHTKKSEMNNHNSPSDHLQQVALSSKQRSTTDALYAEQKGSSVNKTSATGAATTGTSGSQRSAANKPLQFNQPRSSLKQMDNHTTNQQIVNLEGNFKNYQTIDPADTGKNEKLNSQIGRLNFRHQSEQLQTAVDLPTSCTNNDFAPLTSNRGVGHNYQTSTLTARAAYYTRHQETSLATLGSGTSMQRFYNNSKQYSEKASPMAASSKHFQFQPGGQLSKNNVKTKSSASNHNMRFTQTQQRPSKRHQLSQNDMKQVCAEGDNEFAESIAENSILKDSYPRRDSQRPHMVKSKPGFSNQVVNDGDDLSTNRTVSEKNAKPTPRVIEINEKPQIQKDRTPQNYTRNKDSQFCSFQTQVDPRFAQGYNSGRQHGENAVHYENMFEQIKRKMDQEQRYNHNQEQQYHGHAQTNQSKRQHSGEKGNSQVSIYFQKEGTPKSDVYYKQSLVSHQQASNSFHRMSNVSIQTPKPQPKPFNPPRASFTHFKKFNGRHNQQQRQQLKVKGHNSSYGAQKLDNHKNEMLGGDSEYSDIDVNSDEERDDDSNDNMNERSYSGSGDLNDSKYSQSKPEDNRQNLKKIVNHFSDRKESSSRNHKVHQLSKRTFSHSSDVMKKKKSTDNVRTHSEQKLKVQSYLNHHSRLPSNSMRSQKSYFDEQHNMGENITEFQINNENNDDLKEGSAYLVQESNGPGSRCRKGSLNMRNKLNNKAIQNKLVKPSHMRLYQMDNNKHQDNIDITSDDSQVGMNIINRQILKKNMKSKVYGINEQNEERQSREPSTANLDPNIDEKCQQRNLVTTKSPFQKCSMRQKQSMGTYMVQHNLQKLEQFPSRNHEINQTRENLSEEESCDANVETVDADSSTRSLNRQQSVSINRNIFELSLKLNELVEVPLSKLKSNQQLKILDLSRNKIQMLPQDMFYFLPNLKKITLDYNQLMYLPKIEDPLNESHKPTHSSIRESCVLQKLNHFSATNNKIMEFPLSLFIKCKQFTGHESVVEQNQIINGPVQLICSQRQHNIQHIALNDNSIQQIPSQISIIKSLRTLMLHSNPLSMIPLSLKEIWPQFDVFSIDWFTYLQPLVGKILRVDNSSSFREDTSQANPGNTLDDQENYAIELALDNVRDKSRFHKKRDSAQSASRLKQNVIQKKNLSLIPGLQGKGKGTNLNARSAQRERSQRIHDKFFRLLTQTKYDHEQNNHHLDFLTFSQFLLFFMTKNGTREQQTGQSRKETLENLKYGPKERSIIHQLIEDNKLVLFRDLINLNSIYKDNAGKPIIDINEQDHDEATPLVMALKNRCNEIAKYLLKFHPDSLNIQIKSKKHGNAINLAIKGQNPEIIDMILNHKQVKSTDSFVLNYIIPNFEKDPKENAKFMVKLIMDKGMNPNQLRERYLKKELVSQRKQKDENLPEKILDVSPIALACMKYQNNAINFIVKYNSTIREILILNRKIKKKNQSEVGNKMKKNVTPEKNISQQYWTMIGSLDQNKADRVRKFFTYIEDISKNKGITLEKVIERNLKLFDFNQLSGPHLMHPLHFAVQANNIKAIEKFKKHLYSENINFFSRDEENYELPQEYAAPSAPIYKMVLRIQKNLMTKKHIQMKIEKKNNNANSNVQPQPQQVQQRYLQKNQTSVGEQCLELNRNRMELFQPIQHRCINFRHSTFKNPKYVRQNDILNFTKTSQVSRHPKGLQINTNSLNSVHNQHHLVKTPQKNENNQGMIGSVSQSDLGLNYNTLIQKNVMRNIDNKIHLKSHKQNMKPIANNKKFKSGFHGISYDGQQNLTARESQISNGTLPYNVSQGGQRDSHKTNQTNATQKYQMGRLGLGTVQNGGMIQQQAHSSHIFNFENEINQNNLDILSNNSSTRRTVRGSEKFNIGNHYKLNQDKLMQKQIPQVQVSLRGLEAGGSQMMNRQKPKSTRESLDRFQKNRSLKNIHNSNHNLNNSDNEENMDDNDAYIMINKVDRGMKETQEQCSIESLEMDQEINQKNLMTPQHSQSVARDWSSNARLNNTNKVQNQGRIDPANNIQQHFKNDLSFQKSDEMTPGKKLISQIQNKMERQRFFKQSSSSSNQARYYKNGGSVVENQSHQSNMDYRK